MKQELLDLYSDYLISAFSQTTATGLSELLGGAITHDRITNFLAESSFTSKDLWLLVKKNVRQAESVEAVIVFDDTIEEKPYSAENAIVCYHYDHTKGKNVKGINILNCLYYSQGVSLPLASEIIKKDQVVTDEKTGQPRRKSLVSKNEMMRSMLDNLQHQQVQYRYAVVDTWFSSTENMHHIKLKVKKDFVMAIKSNRLVALSLEDKLQGRFVSLDKLSFSPDVPLTVYLSGLTVPILLVKQIFKHKEGGEGILFLACSDLSLTGPEIQTIYQKRWKVEEFHKSIKSNTALAKSPAHTVTTQSNHIFASIYAFVKLERIRIGKKMNHFALKAKLYLRAITSSFEILRGMQLTQG